VIDRRSVEDLRALASAVAGQRSCRVANFDQVPAL
jgi:hypothetical protein